MNEYTWKQAYKDIPKTFKQGCIGIYDYCRNAPLRARVTEILWLIILVAMIHYGIFGILNFYEGTEIDPNSGLGWFLSFFPLFFIAAVFGARAILSIMAKAVFKWVDEKSK